MASFLFVVVLSQEFAEPVSWVALYLDTIEFYWVFPPDLWLLMRFPDMAIGISALGLLLPVAMVLLSLWCLSHFGVDSSIRKAFPLVNFFVFLFLAFMIHIPYAHMIALGGYFLVPLFALLESRRLTMKCATCAILASCLGGTLCGHLLGTILMGFLGSGTEILILPNGLNLIPLWIVPVVVTFLSLMTSVVPKSEEVVFRYDLVRIASVSTIMIVCALSSLAFGGVIAIFGALGSWLLTLAAVAFKFPLRTRYPLDISVYNLALLDIQELETALNIRRIGVAVDNPMLNPIKERLEQGSEIIVHGLPASGKSTAIASLVSIIKQHSLEKQDKIWDRESGKLVLIRYPRKLLRDALPDVVNLEIIICDDLQRLDKRELQDLSELIEKVKRKSKQVTVILGIRTPNLGFMPDRYDSYTRVDCSPTVASKSYLEFLKEVAAKCASLFELAVDDHFVDRLTESAVNNRQGVGYVSLSIKELAESGENVVRRISRLPIPTDIGAIYRRYLESLSDSQRDLLRSIRLLKILDVPNQKGLVRQIYTGIYNRTRWDDDCYELERMTIWYKSDRDLMNAYDVPLESLWFADVPSVLYGIWNYSLESRIDSEYLDDLLGAILYIIHGSHANMANEMGIDLLKRANLDTRLKAHLGEHTSESLVWVIASVNDPNPHVKAALQLFDIDPTTHSLHESCLMLLEKMDKRPGGISYARFAPLASGILALAIRGLDNPHDIIGKVIPSSPTSIELPYYISRWLSLDILEEIAKRNFERKPYRMLDGEEDLYNGYQKWTQNRCVIMSTLDGAEFSFRFRCPRCNYVIRDQETLSVGWVLGGRGDKMWEPNYEYGTLWCDRCQYEYQYMVVVSLMEITFQFDDLSDDWPFWFRAEFPSYDDDFDDYEN
jgi:energy-coupling factor transporter ATP-binding protein EcfA2